MADTQKLPTKFAPAERAPEAVLKRQIELFQDNEVLDEFLGKIPAVFIIVNKFRQVVYMNQGALVFTGLDDVTSVIGKRPGEIFGCVHAHEEEGGCGTSESCEFCGAVRAVLKSLKGINSIEDARLILGPNEVAYDLRIWAAPLTIKNEEFYAVTIQDISDEKRRSVLERVFFHDILNTTSGLLSTVEIMIKYGDKIDHQEFLHKLDYLINTLIDEIQSQRLINQAERDELTVNLSTFSSMDLLNEMTVLYSNQTFAKNKNIKIDSTSDDIKITSDRTLLKRIISNIVKNALEAISDGETITLGCNKRDNSVQFWVHNPGFIPRDVQLQIFQRSFSTKGAGRGLGTYGMKLLSTFLNGNVNFSTSEQEGTTFTASYPITLKAN